MSAEIVALPGNEIRAGEPVQPIIELLEELLARARAGEVRSLAYVWIDGGDVIAHNWYRGDRYNSQLLGSMVNMQYAFQKEWDKT